MKLIRVFLLLVFIPMSAFSLFYIISKTLSPTGGVDFHSYWYSGQFLRQGVDPYTAFVEKRVPQIPITFLDGLVQYSPVAQTGLAQVPANTPLMVELLTIFSFLSWPVAKIVWMVCNLGFILLIPFLIFQLFPSLNNRQPVDKLLFVLVFMGLFGTRNVAGNGQTSLLILAAMLLAILADENHRIFSGIALGFALSKYSLALPLLILFLIEGKYRQVIVGLSLQVAATLALSVITSQPVGGILAAYARIVQLHTTQPGIHLSALFPAGGFAGKFVVFFLSLVIASFLGYLLFLGKKQNFFASSPITRLTFFSILMIWTLLIAYHRAYDTVVMVFVIALIPEWLFQRREMKAWQRWLLKLFLGATIVILTLPARGISILALPGNAGLLSTWLHMQSNSITFMLIAAMACLMWMLYQYPQKKFVKA